MYEAFFGLRKRPFASFPRTEDYFPGASVQAARQNLARCIDRAEGAGLVIGPTGTGKTLLCQVLAEQFGESFHVVLLSSGRLSSRRALLQAVLYGLGQPYRGMDEGELRIAMTDFLTSPRCRPNGMLLLVDEAHTLPLRLLDEIRMLTNLVSDGRARVRLAMAGGPALEERLATPRLASFSQRITARCYLEAFNRGETESYVHTQVERSGGRGPSIFPAETCSAIHQATDGVPRLINQVCDHAMLLTYTAGRTVIERPAIEEAWSDLQQLPSPWNGESKSDAPAGAVIEFGGLAEESESSDPMASDSVPAKMQPPIVSEEIEPASPEPSEQIERIEQMLGELDGEFQPAGSIGPEVELVFDNPFAEQFAEEEVIVDRRAACFVCASEVRANNTPEGMLRPALTAPAETPLQDRIDARIEAAAEVMAPEPNEPPATVPIHQAAAERLPAPSEPNDAEEAEIVVEDEGEDFQWQSHQPIVAVRRHQYRQLFTRLRHG